jgi:hypothetical protein
MQKKLTQADQYYAYSKCIEYMSAMVIIIKIFIYCY